MIQANLADVGITCEIKQNDSGTFWTLGSKDGDYFMDLQLVLSRFSMQPDRAGRPSGSPRNRSVSGTGSASTTPNTRRCMRRACRERPGKRDVIYKKMQSLMDESGCYVFLTHEVVGAIHRDEVAPGLKPNGESMLA